MFYLFKYITYNTDGANPTPGVYTYTSQSEAVANFHSTIGAAMKQANVASALAVILNERGEAIKRERYVAEVTTSSAVVEGID